MSAVITDFRQADGNTFISQTVQVVYAGGLSGSVVEQIDLVIHPDGSVNFNGVDVCACTLAGTGRSGTIVFPFSGTGDATGAATGRFTIKGTGSLANLHGVGTFQSSNGGSSGGFSGVYHFDLSFTYQDTTPPAYTAMSIASNVVTVTYSEPTCKINTAAFATDWTVNNVSGATNDPVIADNTPLCTAAKDNGVTTANLFLSTAMPPGAFVEADLNTAAGVCVNATTCNPNFRDASNNTIVAPQGQTASATSSPGGAPSILSASGAVAGRLVTIRSPRG